MTRVASRLALLRAGALLNAAISAGRVCAGTWSLFHLPTTLRGFRQPISAHAAVTYLGPHLASIAFSLAVLALAPRIAAASQVPPADEPIRSAEEGNILTVLAGLFALDQVAMRVPELLGVFLPVEADSSRFFLGVPFAFGPRWWIGATLWAAVALVLLVGPARVGGWVRRTFFLPRSSDGAGA